MAKSSRGGQRAANLNATLNAPTLTVNIAPAQITPPSPADVAKGIILPKGGVAFDKFAKMTDDEKADVILKATTISTPLFLDNSDLQKLAYFTGLSDKPTIVPDSQLDSMPGYNLYRSVHDTYDSYNDIGFSALEIYKQVATGDYTMYSDSGGSAHGKAIYMDTQYGSYGSGRKDGVMRAKIAKNAKIVTESSLNVSVANEMSSGSKLGKALYSVDRHSRMGIYCLAKGIDAYKVSNSGYHMIINRKALVMSDTVKNGGHDWSTAKVRTK